MKLFASSKKITLALAIVILGSLFGVGLAIASDRIGVGPATTSDQIDDFDYSNFYQSSYDRATPEQREQLDAIFADLSYGTGEWRRPVLLVLGDLPADTPRLTAQDAARLYGKVEFENMDEEFNKIAGAPDWVGGSGIYREIYFLNDERTEAIYLVMNEVHYVVFNEDGTQTRLPVGDQILPPSPGPSEAPNIDNIPKPPKPSPTSAPVFEKS